ncbi:MAG: hypothetical protein JSS30_01730 [Verrucomicrobia bacterium]|nr:hypothetical protein [Verrucomicrobiota bacterium]
MLFLLIFYCGTASGATTWQEVLKEFWQEFSNARQITTEQGFLCQDLKTFFEESPNEAILLFFPKECGFDRITKAQFLDLEEFFALAESYGYEVTYCSFVRYLASFKTREEMGEFVKEVFGAELKEEDLPLYFPIKLVVAELLK